MSKQIPVGERPLTEEEIAYLNARGRRSEIVANARMVEEGEFERRAAEETVSWEEEVDGMTVAELKEELEARGLSTTGNKAELQGRLYEAGPED